MSLPHLPKPISVLLEIAVIFFVFWQVVGYFGLGNYTHIAALPSPGGHWRIHEFKSNSDHGSWHAPYGRLISLATGSIGSPDDGYVFFAGYCGSGSLRYVWENEKKITITCATSTSATSAKIRTLTRAMYGITVEFLTPYCIWNPPTCA